MDGACDPPVHRFTRDSRTCACGEVTVPDPALRFCHSFGQGLGSRRRRPREGPGPLANLRVPKGPRKPPGG